MLKPEQGIKDYFKQQGLDIGLAFDIPRNFQKFGKILWTGGNSYTRNDLD